MDYRTFYCKCGCNNGVIMKYEKDDEDNTLSMSLVTDMFYTGGNGRWTLREKLKRIWCIIRNKEYCYFDIIMDKDDVQKFKSLVNKF